MLIKGLKGLNMIKIPIWQEATSWLFTGVVEGLIAFLLDQMSLQQCAWEGLKLQSWTKPVETSSNFELYNTHNT